MRSLRREAVVLLIRLASNLLLTDQRWTTASRAVEALAVTINLDALEPLRTARLNLRCVHPGDAADISRSMTAAVSQWVISWPVPFSLEMAADRIDDARTAAASGDMLPLVVERLGDDVFLGWLSVTRIAERRGLLSYWLGENTTVVDTCGKRFRWRFPKRSACSTSTSSKRPPRSGTSVLWR